MKKRSSKSLIAGILATGIMSIVSFLLPLIGLPELSPPEMLAEMMHITVYNGWAIHLIIGIVFTFFYTFVFQPKVKISGVFFKGVVFGLAVFVFAQIILATVATVLPIPETQDSLTSIMISSIMVHIVFGIAVSTIVGDPEKLGGIGFHDNH